MAASCELQTTCNVSYIVYQEPLDTDPVESTRPVPSAALLPIDREPLPLREEPGAACDLALTRRQFWVRGAELRCAL
jgi:hypothetical protein